MNPGSRGCSELMVPLRPSLGDRARLRLKKKLHQTQWGHSHVTNLLAPLVGTSHPVPTKSPPFGVLSAGPSASSMAKVPASHAGRQSVRLKAQEPGTGSSLSSWTLVCLYRPSLHTQASFLTAGPVSCSSFRPNTKCRGNSFAQISPTAPMAVKVLSFFFFF